MEKIEKLELSLSKQHNKMLKIKSEMLKIIKNVKMIKLGKVSRKKFPAKFFREFPESRGFLRSREFSGIPGKLKILDKRETLAIQHCAEVYGVAFFGFLLLF